MTVTITSRAAATGTHMLLSLKGTADDELLAMIADGIVDLVTPGRSVTVNVQGLRVTSAKAGIAVLARLLDERCNSIVLSNGDDVIILAAGPPTLSSGDEQAAAIPYPAVA